VTGPASVTRTFGSFLPLRFFTVSLRFKRISRQFNHISAYLYIFEEILVFVLKNFHKDLQKHF